MEANFRLYTVMKPVVHQGEKVGGSPENRFESRMSGLARHTNLSKPVDLHKAVGSALLFDLAQNVGVHNPSGVYIWVRRVTIY